MNLENPLDGHNIEGDEILDVNLTDEERGTPNKRAAEYLPFGEGHYLYESELSELDSNDSPELFVDKHLVLLGLKREDLIGKKVLDVGAEYDRFAQACKAIGLSVEIFSIDKNYRAGPSPDSSIRTGKYAKGNALVIPFRDETFDIVISTYALPIMAKSKSEEVERSITEMLRVVKRSGLVVFTPIPGLPTYYDIQGNLLAGQELSSDRNYLNDKNLLEKVDNILNELAAQGYICIKEIMESRKGKKISPLSNVYGDRDFYRVKISKP